MRKSFVLLALVFASIFGPMASAEEPKAIANLRNVIKQKMPGVRIGEIRALPYAGLYEVVANGLNVFYTDAKGEIALMGEMIDLSSRRNLSRERIEALRTVDFDSLPLDKAIVNVKGDGSRRLAIFSDPDCPYCKQLERDLSAITDVTIYTFLFPLPSLHPDATRKAELVWCAEDRVKAWDELMLAGREPAGTAQCETPIREIARVAERFNIAGTPGLIFGNGRLVPGTLPRLEIEKLLNASPRKGPSDERASSR